MTSLQPRTEQPPEGLARGKWEAPRWAVAALGAVVVLGALGFLLWRARKALRARRGTP